MIIMMEITLTDYIRWFCDNHAVKSLDSRVDGVIVAPVGDSYLVRLGRVKE